jgi:hypothetical protein
MKSRTRIGVPRLLTVVALAAGVTTAIATPASAAVGFKARTTLVNETSTDPTSLQFGPDGRLYVAQQNGLIKIYTITRQAPTSSTNPGTYSVTATQTITAIQAIPNYDDGGAPNASVTTRLITGIYVTGTAANPVIYVTSSDPRTGAADSNSGVISRLRWNGSSWVRFDLVRGLPRSKNVHTLNGMALDTSTNTLYVAIGGNTNLGAPSSTFGNLPEYAYSAAILSVDLTAIGTTTYDLPTLDDQNRAGNPDANDPFGGDNGNNQARLVAGGPVQVFASGFRNPYDILLHSNGKLYATDNGANAGSGGLPVGEGTTTCTNTEQDAGFSDRDGLYLITGAGYYQGHPNPTRANRANTFDPANPQSPIPSGMQNPIECDYQSPGSSTLAKENDALTTFNYSTDGIAEYTASNFSGAMQGDVLVTNFNDIVYRIVLNSTGTAVASKTSLFSFSNTATNPLDVTAQGDNARFPGTIWVANNGTDDIAVFEPNDFDGSTTGTCTGAYNTSDEDGDGYTNADEIDNGTDPCSAASVPPDADGDHVSDLNDPDDDNDGISDLSDPFAVDASNGTSTTVPFNYTWDFGATYPGILGSGFTGLMTNGSTDYLTLFDPAQMTVGSASGVFTIDSVGSGDAYGALNTQQNGFQLGVPTSSSTAPFTLHTKVLTPFAGTTPAGSDSMGLFIGTGDQDNYLKIVAAAGDGSGAVQVVKEVGGAPTQVSSTPVAMPGPDALDLYLAVDPSTDTVQPQYRVTSGGIAGAILNLGSAVTIPAAWVGGPALATGIISTSRGGSPFTFSLDVFDLTTAGPPPIFRDGFETGTMAAWSAVNRVTVVSGDTPPGGGTRAARATSTTGTTAFAYKQLPSTYTDGWMRVWVKVAQQGSTKVNLLRVGTATGAALVTICRSAAGNICLRNAVAAKNLTSTVPISTGWHRIELHTHVGGTTSSSTEVFLDGTRVGLLANTLSLGTAPVGRVWIGEVVTKHIFDVLFDDVMVSTS